jgi:hypothetical protein
MENNLIDLNSPFFVVPPLAVQGQQEQDPVQTVFLSVQENVQLDRAHLAAVNQANAASRNYQPFTFQSIKNWNWGSVFRITDSLKPGDIKVKDLSINERLLKFEAVLQDFTILGSLNVYTDYILTAISLYTFAVPTLLAVTLGVVGALAYKRSSRVQKIVNPVFNLFNSVEKRTAVHAVGIVVGVLVKPAVLLAGSTIAGFRLSSYLLKQSHSPVAIQTL